METNRREFIKTMSVVTVCACTGLTGLSGCSMFMGVSDTAVIPEETFTLLGDNLELDLDKIECLKQPGGAGKIKLQAEEEIKLIIVHHEEGHYKAFADKCTHGGRELNFNHKDAQFKCSSFGHSTFRVSGGEVIKGPAEEALKSYPVIVQEEKLIVILG
jgi:cytochrome b6-f complex iron-sulfur subunit